MLRASALTVVLALLVATLPAVADPAPTPYAAIDRHALKAPPRAEESVASLARYLSEPAANDRDKARAIYRWITDRITYDADALFAGRIPEETPEQTLKTKKALCGGYAGLFKALCKEAGVEAIVVSGKVKGFVLADSDAAKGSLHAWNAIKLGDEWHLVDATWGAGGMKDRRFVKNFRNFYFFPPPEAMVFTHLPRQEKYQFLEKPISEDAFVRRPKVSARFFEVGLTPAGILKAIDAEDFSGLVKIYDTPGRAFVLKEAPLEGALKAKKRYNFVLETTDFPSVIVSSGGRSFPLTRNGRQLKGTIIAPRGTIKVQGVIREGRKIVLWDLLEYEGK